MAKIQIKNSFITSSAQITISSSLVRFSDNIRAKGITGSFSGSFAGSNLFVQGGNSFGTTALLGTNDNQALALETNGSEKLRVTSAGNVGIGTSNPIAKLHTVGSNGSTDYVYQQWSYISNVGVYDLILKQTVTSNVVRYNFSMNNASTAYNDVLVLDRGCVGIGTSFPLSKLDVRGTMYVNYGSNGTGYIQTNGTDSDLQITTATNLTSLLNTGTSGAMAFGAGNSERMRILSGGNIGIGTTSPTQKLEVAGYAMAGESSYRTSIYGNASGAWIAFGDTSNTVSLGRIGAYNSLFNINSVNGDTSFQYNGSEKMRITTGGNVGIGTTSPSYKLDIVNAAVNTIRVQNTADTSDAYLITQNTLGSTFFGINATGGYIYNSSAIPIMFYTSGVERMRINSSGNVGIGITSPAYTLDVVGPTVSVTNQPGIISRYTANVDGRALIRVVNSSGNPSAAATHAGISFVAYSNVSNRPLTNTHEAQIMLGGTGTGTSDLKFIAPQGMTFWVSGSNVNMTGSGYINYGSQAIAITPGRRVGIGSSSPGNNLDVYNGSGWAGTDLNGTSGGELRFLQSGTLKANIYASTSTALVINSGDATIFQIGASEKMRLTGGNLGIGTTSPTAALEVNGSIHLNGNIRDVWNDNIWNVGQYPYNYSTSPTYYMGFQVETATRIFYISNKNNDGSATDPNGGIIFRTGGTPTNRMIVSYSGNVGIGTTSPVAKLHITGSSTAAVFYGNVGIGTSTFTYSTSNRGLLELYGATDSLIALRNSNNPFYIQKYSTNVYLNNTDNGAFILYTNNTERMRIDANGNVGIGTTSPKQKLDVSGAGGKIAITNTGNTDYAELVFYEGSSVKADIWVNGSAQATYAGVNSMNIWQGSNAPIAFYTNGTNERMRISADGNVGIGTSTSVPSPLTVYNNADVWHFRLGSSTGELRFGGATNNGAVIQSYTPAGVVRDLYIQRDGGNVGIGTNAPIALLDVRGNTKFGSSLSNTHQFTGSVNFGGSTYNNSIAIDKFEYFSLQPYIEGGSFPSNVFSLSGTFPTFVTMTGSACPFGKVAYNVSYYEAIGDYIPVQAGETLYGEIWAYRSAGATGTAGVFYCGIARYDKDKRAIDGNAGLNYFIVQNATVPSNSTWTKYSNTTTLPLTHTPYAGSDGGPVRYVRPYIIVNYTAGTVPTYWAAFKIRKQQLTRDLGAVVVSGSMGIGTSSPSSKLHIYENANRVSYLAQNNNHTARFEAYGTATAIDTSASNGIFYRINGSDIVKFAADGNVGIGTSSPANLLHVAGTIRSSYFSTFYGMPETGLGLLATYGSFNQSITFASSNTNNRSRLYFDAYTSDLYIQNSTDAGSTINTRLFIKSNGCVGIGVTSPLQILHVNGNILLDGTTNGYTQGATRGIGYGSNSGGVSVDGFSGMDIQSVNAPAPYGGNYSQNVRFWTHHYGTGTGGTPRMIIQYNGNVGIGTTAPAYKFDLVGSGSVSIVNVAGRIRSNVGSDVYNTGTVLAFTNTTSNANAYAYIGSRIDAAAAGDNAQSLIFATNATNTLPTEKLRITSTGNVGIGSSSPIAKLDINGTTNFAANVYHSIGGQKFFAGSGGAYSYIYTGTTALNFINGGDTSTLMTILNGGNVGIGTSSPAYKLEVNGNFAAAGGSSFGTTYPQLTINGTTNQHTYVVINRTNYEAGVQLQTSGTTKWWMYMPTGDDTTLRFYSGADRVTFKNDGNVGIGTTSPNTLLNVHGANPFVRINDTSATGHGIKISYNNSDTHGLHLTYNGNGAQSYIDNTYGVTSGQPYGDIYFRQNVSGTMTTRMTIKADGGSIGIGTTSPTVKLAVSDGTTIAQVNPYAGVAYFGTVNNYPMALSVNSSEKVRIDTSGNVGIGTTSPSTTLTVIATNNTGSRIQLGTASTSTFMDANKVNDFMVMTAPYGASPASVSNGGAKWGIKMNGSTDSINTKAKSAAIYAVSEENSTGYNRMVGLALHTSGFDLENSEKVRIKNDGNVGIGSTSPVYKLDVNGTFRSTGDLWTNGNIVISRAGAYLYINGTNSDSEIVWQANGSNRWAAGMNVGDATENFNIYNYTTATTNFTILKANGNVGIGSTAPAYKLDVNGGVNLTGILSFNGVAVLNESSNANDIYANIRVIRNMSSTIQDGMYINYNSPGTTGAHLRFYANGTSERMRIQANDGFVGIGTSAAVGRLDVYDSTDAGHVAFVRNASTGTSAYSAIVLRRNGDANGIVLFTNSSNRSTDGGAGNSTIRTDNGNLLLGAGGTTYHVLNTAGSVGIGTTTVESGCLVTFKASNTARLSITDGSTRAHLWPTGGNFYLSTETASDMIIITNATERMRITSAGNVGIGTTSPAQKLHVVGAVYGTTYGQFGTSVASGTNSSYAVFGSNSAVVGVKINIDSNVNRNDLVVSGSTGNVGIGTSQVLSKLNAYASGSNLSVFRVDGGNGTLFEVTDQLSGSLFSVNDVSGLPLLEVFSNNRVVAGKYGSNALVVSGSSVGIGTSRPSSRLQLGNLTSTSTATPETLSLGGTFSNSAGANVKLRVYEDGSGGAIGGMSVSSGQMEVNTWSAGKIAFYRGTTQTAIIDASGNVGIGTSSPTQKLDIVGSYATADDNAGILKIRGSGVGPTQLNFGVSADGGYGWIQTTDIAVTNEKNIILNPLGGNVGIGTTSPGSKLDVNGSIRTTSKFVQNSTTVSVSGTGQTLTLNLDTAAVYVVSMASGATITTISYTNRDNNPSVNTIMLVVKYAGSASITFTNVIWANGVAPTLTGTNGYADVFMLTSYQGGAGTPVWIGTVVSQALVSTNL